VHKHVAETCDSAPVNLRVMNLQRFGEPLRGLGERLEVAQRRVLRLFVLIEGFGTCRRITLDPGDGVKDVREI